MSDGILQTTTMIGHLVADVAEDAINQPFRAKYMNKYGRNPLHPQSLQLYNALFPGSCRFMIILSINFCYVSKP
jgi:hypothetical protein